MKNTGQRKKKRKLKHLQEESKHQKQRVMFQEKKLKDQKIEIDEQMKLIADYFKI